MHSFPFVTNACFCECQYQFSTFSLFISPSTCCFKHFSILILLTHSLTHSVFLSIYVLLCWLLIKFSCSFLSCDCKKYCCPLEQQQQQQYRWTVTSIVYIFRWCIPIDLYMRSFKAFNKQSRLSQLVWQWFIYCWMKLNKNYALLTNISYITPRARSDIYTLINCKFSKKK